MVRGTLPGQATFGRIELHRVVQRLCDAVYVTIEAHSFPFCFSIFGDKISSTFIALGDN